MEHTHNGHRDRLRKKFLENGLESLQEHEILELLLFYAIPRKNTNEIAHELINRFGSIAKVLDADIELLKEVQGISDSSATLIKMIPQLCNVYLNCDSVPVGLNDLTEYKDFSIKQYIGIHEEVLKAIYLDNNQQYIACDNICTIHSPNTIIVNMRRIIERAEKHSSSSLILLHNHPNGSTTPSNEDKISTKKAYKILHDIGITLMDHIIVTKNDALSMRNSGYFL